MQGWPAQCQHRGGHRGMTSRPHHLPIVVGIRHDVNGCPCSALESRFLERAATPSLFPRSPLAWFPEAACPPSYSLYLEQIQKLHQCPGLVAEIHTCASEGSSPVQSSACEMHIIRFYLLQVIELQLTNTKERRCPFRAQVVSPTTPPALLLSPRPPPLLQGRKKKKAVSSIQP